MADTDCASESASSVGDEERVRRLFQACDANGDGYIDSQDLLAICRELSLEDSLDELMLQLGADAQGRISYEQFLRRRLALRPEIDALKGPKHRDSISDKLDSWEWDSGARDMSPVPKTITKQLQTTYTEGEFKTSYHDPSQPSGQTSRGGRSGYRGPFRGGPVRRGGGKPRPHKSSTSTGPPKPTSLSTTATVTKNDPLFLNSLVATPGMELRPVSTVRKVYSSCEAITNLIDLLHAKLCALSPGYAHRVPKSALAYYVAAITYAAILKKHALNGYVSLSDERHFYQAIEDFKPDAPKILQLYIQGFGNTTLPNGRALKFSLPPREYIAHEPTNTFGWFGRVTAQTHTLYKQYPCLAVYAKRISEDILRTNLPPKDAAAHADWDLPADLQPVEVHGLPTSNMLGYDRAALLTPAQNQWIMQNGFDIQGTYASHNATIPLITDLLVAVQMELSAIDRLKKVIPCFELTGSLAQVSIVKYEPTVRGAIERAADITINSPVDIVGALVVIDGAFMYRTTRDTARGVLANWSIYSFGNFNNVPKAWRNTINMFRLLEPPMLQEIEFATVPIAPTTRMKDVMESTTIKS